MDSTIKFYFSNDTGRAQRSSALTYSPVETWSVYRPPISERLAHYSGFQDAGDELSKWSHLFPNHAGLSSEEAKMESIKLCAVRETFEEAGILLTECVSTGKGKASWKAMKEVDRKEWRDKVSLMLCLWRLSVVRRADPAGFEGTFEWKLVRGSVQATQRERQWLDIKARTLYASISSKLDVSNFFLPDIRLRFAMMRISPSLWNTRLTPASYTVLQRT